MTRAPGAPGSPAAGTGGDSRRRAVLAVLLVLALAACLRAPITSVGPLLDTIGVDTGLAAGLLGLLGSLPLLGFAAISPVVHLPAMRFGPERVVAVALVVLTLGIVLRSTTIPGGLWLGTVLLGCGIAAGNVLAPAIIKRDQPGRIALITACFTAVMGTAAGLGSGLSVPLSQATGGWRSALALWAVPVALVAVLWLLRSRRARRVPAVARAVVAEDDAAGAGAAGAAGHHGAEPEAAGRRVPREPAGRRVSMWRSAAAWQVTVFMGVQSATFYIMVTWLPNILSATGMDREVAGWMLFVFQVWGILAGFGVTRLMAHRSDLRPVAVVISTLMAAGSAGLALTDGAPLLWVLLVATGSGASLVVALSLFGLRTRTSAQTAQLSGMAQSIGYLIAAAGPVVAGVLHDAAGSWTPALIFLVTIAVVQGAVGLWAGRPGYVQPR